MCLPAWDSVPIVRRNLHVWGRLRQLARQSPDTGQDLENSALAPFLPPAGPVGFVSVSPADPKRTWFFLQYSLAPRTLVPSIDQEFVIEHGVPTGATGLGRDPRFALVKAFGDDLRVFRRVSR